MASFSGGANTICPFYIKEAKKSITCEGLIDGVDCLMRFTDEGAKIAFQAENCERGDYFARCPQAVALEEKYEGEE